MVDLHSRSISHATGYTEQATAGLGRRWSREARLVVLASSLQGRVRRGALYGAIVLTVTFTAIWGGRVWYRAELEKIRRSYVRELQSVSRLLLQELQQWRAERLGDAQVMMSAPHFQSAVASLLTTRLDDAGTGELRRLLTAYNAYDQYDQSIVVDATGATRFREPANGPDLPASERSAVAAIIAAGTPALLDFYFDSRDSHAYLALVVPIGPGAIVLRIEPDAFLHPLLEEWPGSSRTAENVLVRRDGNDVLFLNDLRFKANTALQERVSLDRMDILAVQAVRGAPGLAEGLDYSGRPAIGLNAAVPGSPWVLSSRLEMAEIDAEVRSALWPIVFVVGLVILSAGTGVLAISQSQQAHFQAKESALLAQRERAAAIHGELLRTSPTIVYHMREVDGSFVPTEVSENIERLTGYSAAESLAPGWWAQTMAPEDLPSAMSSIARLASNDRVSHEFRFRHKDGRTIWVQDQIAVSRRENGRAVEVTGSWSDVTEQHVAEAQLIDNERRLRLALRASRQGLVDIDLPAATIVVSREYAELLGQDPAAFVESAAAWVERLHPDDRERGLREFNDYLAGRTDSYRSEIRQRVGAGWKWLLTHGEIVERTPEGAPHRFIGTAADITDLKTAQIEAQASARLYAALSRCNSAILRSSDEHELFRLVCEAAVSSGAAAMAWVGLITPDSPLLTTAAKAGSGLDYLDRIEVSVDPADPRGRGPIGMSIREQRPVWVNDFPRSAVTSPWHIEGARVGWRASASLPLLQSGRVIGALALYATNADDFPEQDRELLVQVAEEVSFALDGFALERERYAIARQLQDSERRYRTLFEDNSVSMLLLDPTAGTIADANAAAAALYGWDRETLRSKCLFDMAPLHDAMKAKGLQQNAAGSHHLEVQHLTAAGLLIDVEAFMTRVRLDDRDLLLATVLDITERKRAQESLSISEQSLRTSVREKEALLKEVHHRVKNNLQVINSLMRLEAARSADVLVQQVLGEMQRRILSMALLHETLYRGGSFAQVDLSRYLSQLANQVLSSMATARQRIALDINLAPALIDLEQAVPCGLLLNELLSNALKHGFPNQRSGRISVALSVAETDRCITLKVSDTGLGLPSDWEQRREGSLGLQLVADLARQLRGTLTVGTSSGASFTLRFVPTLKPTTPS